MGRSFAIAASALIQLLTTAPALAQSVVADAQPPAHISLVEGVAVLERDGRTDDAPANMPLLAGDRIRTRAGRVEILFADGSTLHLDHSTAVDLQSDELVRLLDGRIRLSIPARARDVEYRIDGPHAWARISQPGDYRAAVIQNAGQTELEFAVFRGAAELMNEGGRTTLRAGERAFARANAAPSYAYVFNSASSDPFDRWSEARRSERLAQSAQYLPEEVQSYAATLEHHGAWEYEPSYGYVWYPRVSYGWRPYYHGRWHTVRPWGWTWIAADPWGWPTHHFGRWGFSARGAWFWIPGGAWSPAWVSWAYAPGYVSWCPLGFNNRAVFGFGHVYRGHDPWRGWTVVAQRDFGVGFVHRRGLVGPAIDSRTQSAFVQRESGPVVTGYAVPRGTAVPSPIRVAGTARRSAPSVIANPAPDAQRSSAPPRVIDLTRRPSTARASDDGRAGIAVGRERMTPDRPLVRAERLDRGAALAAPESQSTPSSRIRTYEPGRTTDAVGIRHGAERDVEMYPRDDRTRTAPQYQPTERPAMRRGDYPRPGIESAPSSRVDRPFAAPPDRRPPSADRPSYGAPGTIDRRPPTGDRGAPPSAGPERSGSPAAAPPPGSRTRPGGGETPPRGTAVRRPGGR